jgi:hypothetical protein
MGRSLAVLFVCGLAALTVPAQHAKKGRAMNTKEVDKHGVKLRLSVPAQNRAGTEILCDVSLINASASREFDYESKQKANYRKFKLVIRDAKGKVVPYTRFGSSALGGDEYDRGSSVVKKLAMGETLAQQYNLSRFFDLTVPGKYTINVSRMLNEYEKKENQFSIDAELAFDVVDPDFVKK